MAFGKKQKASSKYKKTDLTPQETSNANEPNWWEKENGLAEETIAKYGNVTPQKIAERRITPEQQGILAKGNAGDNIANPDALDSAEIDKLHKAEKAMAQTEDNMEPATWSTETAGKNAGITSDVATSKESKPVSEAEKDYYNKAAMSIWDAYRNGLIDKNSATYFTIDALAKAAKNMGRSIGNVGAQFTGGAIDNGQDESDWSKRKDAILAEEIKKETEGVGSAASRQAESEKLDIEAKKIRNAYTPAQLENQLAMFQKELEMADINLDMAHSKTDLINFIKKDPNYAKSPFKMGLVSYLTQSGTAGATQDASKTLSDAMNWILTIVK